METTFTKLVGCRVPIQQAGMGGTAGPDLVVAVAEAGALGMLGAGGTPAAAVARSVEEVRGRTAAPFGVNFLMPFVDRAAVEAAASGGARVIEFFYGAPDASLVALARQEDALVCWQVGSRDEAEAATDAGCDLIVAQGVEAGGHVRGETGLLCLLEAVLESVTVPVLAAGGIGSARGVAGVLAAGAAGARVGTRFLAAAEADVHEAYLDALIAADADDTVLTTTFSNMWPDAPHRVLRRSMDAALALTEEVVAQIELAGGHRLDVPRLAPPSPGRGTTGHVDAMAHYAGQSVGFVTGRTSAAAVVQELAEGAEALLARWPTQSST